MALEFDLQKMTRHFVDRLNLDREVITIEDGSFAFKRVEYGEPTSIVEWPFLSVMPVIKERELKATRKWGITFRIELILYHGQIADTHKIQEQTHERAESLERWVMADRFWNFVDKADSTKHKIIHGFVTGVDHPFIILGDDSLWSASRLQLEGQSEEYFI